ncbi:MAG: Hsp20/alpha crystallin family protein [Acidimicrobiia bacterium]|nr:Hsp20/alpha crystallin family protein [Acidimicrobiia bacterium]
MADIEVKEATPAVSPAETPAWDPLAELESWARRFGFRPSSRWPHLLSAFDGVDFTPLADIEETDKAWTIEVELPGVDKKDVEVETHGRTVVIRGERKEKERTGVLRQRRRVTGSFRYEVTLGGDLDAEAITANLADGELVITVPKAEADQPRKIKVG